MVGRGGSWAKPGRFRGGRGTRGGIPRDRVKEQRTKQGMCVSHVMMCIFNLFIDIAKFLPEDPLLTFHGIYQHVAQPLFSNISNYSLEVIFYTDVS